MVESKLPHGSNSEAAEQVFGSTRWAWRRVKIGRPPEASRDAQSTPKAGAGAFRRLPRRNQRDPLTIKVKLRGGPEAWIEVHARGLVYRCPGVTAVADVLAVINSDF